MLDADRYISMSNCFRCVFTTVDPLTGIKNPENEPERTLKQ